MFLFNWGRGRKRQQRINSSNIESASGEAHPSEIEGELACHAYSGNNVTSLHGSAIHRKISCIQQKYTKRDRYSSHGTHTDFTDHVKSNKNIGSSPCNGISTIRANLETRSAKSSDTHIQLKDHLARGMRTRGTEKLEDNAGKDEDELGNKAYPAHLCNLAVVQKVSRPVQRSSSSIWPLGYHRQLSWGRSYAGDAKSVAVHPDLSHRLKKNVTCFVKTLFRWRTPVSEDGELTERKLQKLFSREHKKATTSKRSRLEASHKEPQQGVGRSVANMQNSAANIDSPGKNSRNTSQLLQQRRDHQINELRDVRAFPIQRSKCEYWINTDSDYVVLVVSGTTNM